MSQAFRCNATALLYLDQQPTHQTGWPIQRKPAHRVKINDIQIIKGAIQKNDFSK